jgi:hypothetical protein
VGYWGKYKIKDSLIRDVFDSTNYSILRELLITVNDVRMPYKFVTDLCDVALSLSTDGFSPFKRQ